ncbi:hypothetical protein BLNAU_19764 [Blattamonas nauphoetae]|uniref:Uncharacterized protein n=1 Tax=Blattamonas nauphoetae TaxID=2049346 RepID=A0ABQ9X0M0_9EUKA|nr:hypothetical protein BLNAU_19764 [Blattamonas nauphoetae]
MPRDGGRLSGLKCNIHTPSANDSLSAFGLPLPSHSISTSNRSPQNKALQLVFEQHIKGEVCFGGGILVFGSCEIWRGGEISGQLVEGEAYAHLVDGRGEKGSQSSEDDLGVN